MAIINDDRKEDDFTRKALNQTERTLGLLQESLRNRITSGPRGAPKSNLERRLEIQNQDPEVTMAMIKKMGPEQWDAYMKEIYNGNRKNS